MGGFGWGQKVYVEKVYVLFPSLITLRPKSLWESFETKVSVINRISKKHVGRTSQLSGFTADFSGDSDGFCDGFFGQEGRNLRRISWRIFGLVFSLGKRRIL